MIWRFWLSLGEKSLASCRNLVICNLLCWALLAVSLQADRGSSSLGQFVSLSLTQLLLALVGLVSRGSLRAVSSAGRCLFCTAVISGHADPSFRIAVTPVSTEANIPERKFKQLDPRGCTTSRENLTPGALLNGAMPQPPSSTAQWSSPTSLSGFFHQNPGILKFPLTLWHSEKLLFLLWNKSLLPHLFNLKICIFSYQLFS